MSEFKLDVNDAIVTVKPTDFGHWYWSFSYKDGSSHISDSDWMPSERGAKECAYARYKMRMNKWGKQPRARWISDKPTDNDARKDG